MTSRERVSTTLSHQEPDRVPVDIGATHVSTMHRDAHENLLGYLGIKPRSAEIMDMIQQAVKVDERILEKLEIDTHCVLMHAPAAWQPEMHEDNARFWFVDEWGVTWQMPKNNGWYFDILNHPLQDATPDDLKNLGVPDPDDPGRTAGLGGELESLSRNTSYALVADLMAGGVLEAIWFQTGLIRYLTDILLDPDFIRRLIDQSLNVQKRLMDNFLAIVKDKVQVVAINGDLGSQAAPILSPELYRSFLKPYEKDISQFVRSRTHANLFRHCCGSIRPLIQDLIDIGVETLNPVQVSASGMDTAILKRDFGDRLSFWGGIDNRVLALGTPQQVREEVRRRIGDLGPGGGYVLGAVHNIQRDVPPRNVVAMVDAARELGEYPIRV